MNSCPSRRSATLTWKRDDSVSRKAAVVIEAIKSRLASDETPRFVRDVTTLSGYHNQDGEHTFIEDATLGCDLDAFKEEFARTHNITMPSSCDGLFLWKDLRDNNDKATHLVRDYSGETLLFVEFKHAPIFKTADEKIDFLHAGQNGGIDVGCYEASIQKKLEDSCILLMNTPRTGGNGFVLEFKDCKRMNAAFIVFSSGKGSQMADYMKAIRMNQKHVFAGLEGYLYRKIQLMSDTAFKDMLEQGQLYI